MKHIIRHTGTTPVFFHHLMMEHGHIYANYQWGTDQDYCVDILGTVAYWKWWRQVWSQRCAAIEATCELAKLAYDAQTCDTVWWLFNAEFDPENLGVFPSKPVMEAILNEIAKSTANGN